VRHLRDSIRIMREVGSRFLERLGRRRHQSPGPGRFPRPQARVTESLQRAYEALDKDSGCSSSNKFFEPAFYSTDIADWGQAYLYCKACGERAKVLVDLGHHRRGRTSSRSSPSSLTRDARRLPLQIAGNTPTTT